MRVLKSTGFNRVGLKKQASQNREWAGLAKGMKRCRLSEISAKSVAYTGFPQSLRAEKSPGR
jgi:hypothetical protein